MLQVGTTITGGQNELRLELLGDDDSRIDVLKYVKLYQCTQIVSGRSKWAFAPWTVPQSREFGPIVTTDSDLPSWYRSTFKATHTDVPLWLEPRGMTKGQIYLNGHNVGRYFVATASGKTVPPQKKYYLPKPWLHTDKSNELLLFEEHDRAPNRCALKYDSKGPYGK